LRLKILKKLRKPVSTQNLLVLIKKCIENYSVGIKKKTAKTWLKEIFCEKAKSQVKFIIITVVSCKK